MADETVETKEVKVEGEQKDAKIVIAIKPDGQMAIEHTDIAPLALPVIFQKLSNNLMKTLTQ